MKKIDYNPGARPNKKLSFEDKQDWNEIYKVLSREDKNLLETQEQTRLLRRISNNFIFYFWLTNIGIIVTLLGLI